MKKIVEVNPKPDKSDIDDDLEVSFVPMPAAETESGAIDVAETKKILLRKKVYTAFKEKDVLFAKITPCMENGKMAVVPRVKFEPDSKGSVLKNKLEIRDASEMDDLELDLLMQLSDAIPELVEVDQPLSSEDICHVIWGSFVIGSIVASSSKR